MALSVILSIIFGVIFIVIFIGVMAYFNREKGKIVVTPNMPLVENPCRQQFTNGYYCGVIKSIKKRKNGTHLVEFYPFDIEQGEDIPRPEFQQVIVKSELLERGTLSRGSPSGRREIIKLLGRGHFNYPNKMRETEEGKWATEQGQKAFLESAIKKYMSEGDTALVKVMGEMSRIGLSKAEVDKLRADFERAKKMLPSSVPETPPGKEKHS